MPPPGKQAPVSALPPATAATLDQVLEHDTLLAVLDAAVAEMSTWLKGSDGAMVELCRRYCRAVDDAVGISERYAEIAAPLWDMAEATDSKSLMRRLAALEKAADVGKTVAWIGPLLANALRDIGGAPGERKGLEADAPVKSRLQELREQKQAQGAKRKAPAGK